MNRERLDELSSVLAVPDSEWRATTVEELRELHDLDYEVVGLAELEICTAETPTGMIYVRHLQHLVHVTLMHVDVWIKLDGGLVRHTYEIKLIQEAYPE